jgi:hypothetical protein
MMGKTQAQLEACHGSHSMLLHGSCRCQYYSRPSCLGCIYHGVLIPLSSCLFLRRERNGKEGADLPTFIPPTRSRSLLGKARLLLKVILAFNTQPPDHRGVIPQL